MYEPHSHRPLSPRQFFHRLLRHFALVAGLVLVSLVVGMAGYMWLAGMTWVDAFLNTAMLLGGMGPIGDLQTTAAKLFAGCYALYAGLLFIASASIIMAPIVHRIIHKLHADARER